MKMFNTSGPVNMPGYYKIDPLKRWNLQRILELIDTNRYFILHAPRQTGKTSCLRALQEYLNTEGKYFALYINVESGQVARNNIQVAVEATVDQIKRRLINLTIDKAIIDEIQDLKATSSAAHLLIDVLSVISSRIPKPVILFVDEIDALIGDSLVSVLRQLRAGYDERPAHYPSSIVLCGMRDIKDYRIHTSDQEVITGGSAFNIKDKSLRLGDFTREEVDELYSQHTTETGQRFAEGCIDLVMQYTEGQPWLVNALAREVTDDMEENRDRTVVITPAMFEIAKENIIISRRSHIEQLGERLSEDRIRRIIQPIILGGVIDATEADDDLEYCVDLGLLKQKDKVYQISNEIYREVIPRELTKIVQRAFTAQFKTGWLAPDGSIDITKLLTMFKDFWLTNSHIWRENIAGYVEAAPHLVIQAFLQRVINVC